MKVLETGALSMFLLLLVFATNQRSYAQEVSYVLIDSSQIVVSGTSTVHDWEVEAEEFMAEITLNPTTLGNAEENYGSFVPILTLTVPVEKMESGKRKMNKKMYDALKHEEYPTIYFRVTSSEIAKYDSLNSTDETFMVNATGELSLAGESKEIQLEVTGSKLDENIFRFTGSYHLNMIDYGIDPPSALFGTIKSGEEVDITFDIVVRPEPTQSK